MMPTDHGKRQGRMEPDGKQEGFMEQGTPNRGLSAGHEAQGSEERRAGMGQGDVRDMLMGPRLEPRDDSLSGPLQPYVLPL